MSKSQRTKGRRGELEARDQLRAHGIAAERVHDQAANGGHDLDTDIGPVEVKRRKRLPAYLKPKPGVKLTMFREDRGEWFVMLRLEDYLEGR